MLMNIQNYCSNKPFWSGLEAFSIVKTSWTGPPAMAVLQTVTLYRLTCIKSIGYPFILYMWVFRAAFSPKSTETQLFSWCPSSLRQWCLRVWQQSKHLNCCWFPCCEKTHTHIISLKFNRAYGTKQDYSCFYELKLEQYIEIQGTTPNFCPKNLGILVSGMGQLQGVFET